MKKALPNRIKFYEFLNGDISKDQLEYWVYNSKSLENELPKEIYIDLISFAFKTGDLKTYISNLVDRFYDWFEYEEWRTIKLLKQISNGEIEAVLASRELNKLYRAQENRIKWPLISTELGIVYDSELDGYPTEAEYQNWNKEALKKQLEFVEMITDNLKKKAKKELFELQDDELKTINMEEAISNKKLHEIFWKQLRFPEFYGENWDAFWDSITGLVKMPNTLVLYNWIKFKETLPQDEKVLKSIIEDYNKESKGKKIKIKAGNK